MTLTNGTEGSIKSKVALIGEAWGAVEEEEKRPFVGPAGQLLNRLLTTAMLPRENCYLDNVFPFRPKPTNADIKKYLDLSKKYPVETDTYKQCRSELIERLQATEANIFVALGNIPLYTLMGMKNITARRGSLYECEALGGRKLLACVHPSAALRKYMFQHYIRYDLVRARIESRTPDLELPKRRLILDPGFTEAILFLQHTKRSKQVAFDIETINDEVDCISFATHPLEAISVPFSHKGNTPYYTIDQEAEVWQLIASILEDKKITKVIQNAMFDTTFLLSRYGIRTCNIKDTMIAQGVVFPEMSKGLDFLCSIYTKEPYYKDEGKKWKNKGMPDEQFWEYNAKDSAVLPEIIGKVENEVERFGNKHTYERCLKMIEPLMYMQQRGIRMDVEGMRKASVETGERISELTDRLQSMCKFPIDPNSPKQLANYFYVTKGLPVLKDRKTGRPTTNAKALARMSGKGVPEASIMMQLRKLNKAKSTYYDMTLDDDNRLRCAFSVVGTKSLRLSSSKTIFGTGANLQNQPKYMRKFMLADEGYVGYELDLKQAENKIVAVIAPEPIMLEAFESGVDVHALTASLIFKKPIDKVNKDDGSCSIGTGEHSERFWGKKANHAFNYDYGVDSFAVDFETSRKEATFIRNSYFTSYPGVKQYHRWIVTHLQKNNRRLVNLLGDKRIFLDRWEASLFREAYSYIPQSTVPGIINEWGILPIFESQKLFKPVELLNQVHDSIWIQIPLALSWSAHSSILKSIKANLEQELHWKDTSFIIPVDCKMGLNFKDMEDVDLTKKDGATELKRAYKKVTDNAKTNR